MKSSLIRAFAVAVFIPATVFAAPPDSPTTASQVEGELGSTAFTPVPVEQITSVSALTLRLAEEIETNEQPDITQFDGYIAKQGRKEEPIGLTDVVLRCLAQNLNIKLSDITNRIAHDEFHAREGIFDLNVGAGLIVGRIDEPSLVQTSTGDKTSVNSSKNTSANASLSQLLPTGGLVQLIFDDDRNKTNQSGLVSPYYRSSGGLSLTQPLLRDAGPLVTQSGIILAQFDNRITESQFRGQVMNELSLSIQTYLDLIFAVANVDVLRISLAQAQELLRVNNAKFKAGVLPELDVLQAQADVASRQEQVIVALQQVDTVSDLLKTRLAEIATQRETGFLPLDIPRVLDYTLDEDRALAEAERFRPDYQQAILNIQKSNLNLDVAQNQTLPKLDVFTNYSGVGVDRSNSGAVDNAADGPYSNWQMGVQLNYPLQNRAARYRYHEAEKRLDAAYITQLQVRDSVVFDVRNGLRAVATNREKIEVGKATVVFNKAKVDTGQKRQAVGLATTFDVLAFQTDLANARINLVRAVIDYNKSIILLEQAKGTLLRRLGLTADEGQVVVQGRAPKNPLGTKR